MKLLMDTTTFGEKEQGRLKSKTPKDTDIISGKQATDFDDTEFDFGLRKASAKVIGS